MIDIDKIFKINKDNSIRGNINISNPILYIFVGDDGREVLKQIYNFNQAKQLNITGIIEYINIGKEFCDFIDNNNLILADCEETDFIKRYSDIYDDFDKSEEISKMIAYIELKFLQHTYSNPIRRRVHFIVEASSEYSTLIDKIITIIDKFLLSRNLAPIIDIFVLINDKPDNTDIQKASTYLLLEKLKNIKENELYNVNMIYLTSNLNNLRTLSKKEDIYTSIARTAIIKDFDYMHQPYDFSYDEGKIIDNAKKVPDEKRGVFYSLGLKTIQRPKDILKFILLATLIDENNKVDEDTLDRLAAEILKNLSEMLESISKTPIKNQNFMDINNVMSIMVNTNTSYNDCDTNLDIIRNFFDDSIDKYFKYNCENNLSFNKNIALNYINQTFNNYILDTNIGYFAAVKVLKKVQTQLKDIKENLIKLNYENQIKLDAWNNKSFLYKRKILENKYQPAFNIAIEYMNYLYKIFAPQITLKTFESFEKELDNLIKNTEVLNRELEASKKQLIDLSHTRFLEEKNELIKINFVNYYKQLTKDYIKNNYDIYFERIYSKIFEVGKNDIDNFYKLCVEFIDEFILEDSNFNLNVYNEILKRLMADVSGEYTEIKVNDLFNKEIIDNKFYFVKLINENNFYSDICVLTDNNSVIEKISNANINYIVYNEKDKLEIIYFIGTFEINSLAYGSSYRQSYEFLLNQSDSIAFTDRDEINEKI